MEGTVRIPLLGEVAAGKPLEMFSVEESLDVPESLWHGRKVFALRVRGQSMIDAGIRDGDYLIVEPCETADNGRTVVAEIDGHVTVKKLFRSPERPGAPAARQPGDAAADRQRRPGPHPRRRRRRAAQVRLQAAARRARRAQRAAPRRSAPATPRPARRAPADADTLDLSLNAIDAQIERWRILSERARRRTRPRERAEMATLGRDLQALREWYERTTKPVLRKAILVDANRIIRRMQRYAAARSLDLPTVRRRRA